jgi:hypothetical protein
LLKGLSARQELHIMKPIEVSITSNGTLTVSPKEKRVKAGEEVIWQAPRGIRVTFKEPKRWGAGSTESGPDGSARARVTPDTPPGMLGCTIEMEGKSVDAGVIVEPK